MLAINRMGIRHKTLSTTTLQGSLIRTHRRRTTKPCPTTQGHHRTHQQSSRHRLVMGAQSLPRSSSSLPNTTHTHPPPQSLPLRHRVLFRRLSLSGNQQPRRRYHIRHLSPSSRSLRTRSPHHVTGRSPLLHRRRHRIPLRRRPFVSCPRTIDIPMATSLESSLVIDQHLRILGKEISSVLPSDLRRRRLEASFRIIWQAGRGDRCVRGFCARARLGAVWTGKGNGV